MLIVIPDKILVRWLGDKEYIAPADEGEAIGIGVGYYLATGKRATIAMSADGFCNALNPLTSLVIPEKVKMNLIISTGRQEPQHAVMSRILFKMLKLLKYDSACINVKIIEKE